MIFLRVFKDKTNGNGRFSAMGTLLNKPIVNFNPHGEFLELKFYLYSNDIGTTNITLICHVKNGQFPRIHLQPIVCGTFVIIRNLAKLGPSELYGDCRYHEIEFITLSLDCLDGNLRQFQKVIERLFLTFLRVIKDENNDAKMPIDKEFSMNLMSEFFPDGDEELNEFLYHIGFLKMVTRVKRLCYTNPTLAQKQTDPNTKMITRILLVRLGMILFAKLVTDDLG